MDKKISLEVVDFSELEFLEEALAPGCNGCDCGAPPGEWCGGMWCG